MSLRCTPSTSMIWQPLPYRVRNARIAPSYSTVPPGGPNRDDVEYAREVALSLCRACPCLGLCRGWFTSLPAQDRTVWSPAKS